MFQQNKKETILSNKIQEHILFRTDKIEEIDTFSNKRLKKG